MEPWYFCPVCGSSRISDIGRTGHRRHRFACSECRAVFLADIGIPEDDYADLAERPDGPIELDWTSMQGYELDIVAVIASRVDPHIARFVADPAIKGWADGYWEYVMWNEHGNQLSFDELAYDGYYADIIEGIVRDPADLVSYLAPDGYALADPMARTLIESLDIVRGKRRR